MYQAILEICAIVSIVWVAVYPLLSKRNKPSMWYVKGCLFVASVYAVCLFIILALNLK